LRISKKNPGNVYKSLIFMTMRPAWPVPLGH
jgi:hypothetical protein